MKSKHECLHSLKDIFYLSGIETNWTSCPLGKKSIEIKINNTSLFNYYSNKVLPLQFELPQINDVSDTGLLSL